jgi:hypothetical protein
MVAIMSVALLRRFTCSGVPVYPRANREYTFFLHAGIFSSEKSLRLAISLRIERYKKIRHPKMSVEIAMTSQVMGDWILPKSAR